MAFGEIIARERISMFESSTLWHLQIINPCKHAIESMRIWKTCLRTEDKRGWAWLFHTFSFFCLRRNNAARIFYKRLASLIVDKSNSPYSITLAWLMTRLSFSLLRSAIQCIRRTRSSRGRPGRGKLPPCVELAVVEARLWITHFLEIFINFSIIFCCYPCLDHYRIAKQWQCRYRWIPHKLYFQYIIVSLQSYWV